MKLLIIIALALSLPLTQPAFAATPAETATAVLDRLYRSTGNFRFRKPNLAITSENRKVASYLPSRNLIQLDEKAYQLCREMGRDSLDALAFIIGHELSHAYQTEIRLQKTRTNFLAYDRGMHASVRTEQAADIQGTFSAYLAGYGVLRVMPRILERIYTAYQLQGKVLPGYPSLDERKRSSAEVQVQVQRMIDVFESANYLLAIGKSDLANASLQYLLQWYEGRELYNNLGMACVLQAQEFWDPQSDPLLYPFELDWSSKLNRIESARGQDVITDHARSLRLKLLEQARLHFAKALTLDPGYTAAKVNMVCLLDMMARPAEALAFYESNLLSLSGKKSTATAQEREVARLAKALTLMQLPDADRSTEGKASLLALSKSNLPLVALLARENLRLLRVEAFAERRPVAEFKLPAPFFEVMKNIQPGLPTDTLRLDMAQELDFLRRRESMETTYVLQGTNGNLVTFVKFKNELASSISVLSDGQQLSPEQYSNLLPARDGFFLKSGDGRNHVLLKLDAQGKVLEIVRYIRHR